LTTTTTPITIAAAATQAAMTIRARPPRRFDGAVVAPGGSGGFDDVPTGTTATGTSAPAGGRAVATTGAGGASTPITVAEPTPGSVARNATVVWPMRAESPLRNVTGPVIRCEPTNTPFVDPRSDSTTVPSACGVNEA
jgi:hypothetical protein